MGALHTLRTPTTSHFSFASQTAKRRPIDDDIPWMAAATAAPRKRQRAPVNRGQPATRSARHVNVPAGQTATSFYFFPPPPSFGLSPGSVQARTIDEGLLIRRWGVRRYKYAAISLPTLSEQGRRRLRFLPLAVRFSRAVTHRTAGRRAGVTEERAFQTTSTERRSIRQEGAEDGAACPSTVHRGLFHSRYISTRRIQQTTLLVSRKQ